MNFLCKAGADPENVEPGGANLFFDFTYKGEQGGVRRVRPLLIRACKVCFIFTLEGHYNTALIHHKNPGRVLCVK